ncbi:type I-B CRISPR-associated endonuclease Cas1b [Thioflexithrix psekupsensis]|uniref:CRISPR-associated endonuclease Cas1 n=1 Tax=Thioflexithrix psekupsensis TaxID=1570016 RepID=A0A251X5Q8_9GAMM|nr:type I-B CRISPR-associated endonuclease Cas1b [Thioflexithrix psekupsensis]OUD13076.1 hypothetical protein TPSD3_10520 [Thioflexithrix psekupsensis]
METLYLLSDTRLSRRDNTLQVTPKEGKPRRFPVETLKHVVVLGSMQFNTELASFLGKNGVRLSFHDFYGYFSGSLEAANPHQSGAVHLGQARIILDETTRLALARCILNGGLHNLAANLRYYCYRDRPDLKPILEQMQRHQENLLQANSIEQLMGCEGMTRQVYYSGWQLINPELTIVRRTRRPPTDRINALISFCNGLVYSACKHELSKTHLDPTLSFVHAPTQARASLALDLAEVFKPVLADRLIFTLVNQRMLKDEDFTESPGFCHLSESGRRIVVEAFREKMDKVSLADDVRGYRTLILREAFRLQSHVLGLTDYQPFLHKV